MALGEQLRRARQARRLTALQVAAATRMKTFVVEALEEEDFGRIAAPIYGKGFIKLYAEYVGIDPAPLIEEYTARVLSPKAPSLVGEAPRQPDPPPAAIEARDADSATPVQPDLFAAAAQAQAEARPAHPVRTGIDPPSERRTVDTLPLHLLFHNTRLTIRRLRAGAAAAAGGIARFARAAARTGRREMPRLTFSEVLWRVLPTLLGILAGVLLIVTILSQCGKKPMSQQVTTPVKTPSELQLAVEPPAPYVD